MGPLAAGLQPISRREGYVVQEYGPPVQKKYLQCPALVTISHLKQFLRMKFDLLPQHKVRATELTLKSYFNFLATRHI
uniref:RAWUL domain-containing protein n=1 Tax=Timema genevievae TaxID=629358 RepID=A0A7R9K6X4_TIMGE|nr:unnamed protein product [Timema genevievae]